MKSHGEHASAWASSKVIPWLFVVTHEALDPGTDAAAILDGCGLGPMMPMTGMLAEQVAPASSIPNGLQLTVPHDDGACAAILDVNALPAG